MKQTAVEWLAEKYNYVTWMRNRDEISAGLADEWRKHYLDQAKQMEKQQIVDTFQDSRILYITNNCSSGEQYYNENYENN